MGLLNLETVSVQGPLSMLPKCDSCGLFRGCESPKMPVSGNGKKGILLIAEAPGADEDARGVQFVGKSGRELEHALSRVGIQMREDCWLHNALSCRPPGNKIPTAKEEEIVSSCRPLVTKALRDLKPKVVVLMGATAVKSVIRPLFPGADDDYGITRWQGFVIPDQKWNAWIVPTFHPAYVGRQEDGGNPVISLMFDEDLLKAAGLERRPWKTPPEWRQDVECYMDDGEAVWALKRLVDPAPAVSFDFETDRLKPDSPDARIYCCAVSDGNKSVAFLWRGEAAKACVRLLRSDKPKIGYNLKMEERWALAKCGGRVKNWVWDGMQAAHVLDNRRRITGLDFQAYVRLGQPDWHSGAHEFLVSKQDGGNAVNRVFKSNPLEMLRYCGMDALLEFKVAEHQIKEMKCPRPW
jgi:uracil-DNA glycosylase family 4